MTPPPIINGLKNTMSLWILMNHRGLAYLAAGCGILLGVVVNELIITLISYGSFWGLFVGSDYSGALFLNSVVLDVLKVVALILIVNGIFQVLREKTS